MQESKGVRIGRQRLFKKFRLGFSLQCFAVSFFVLAIGVASVLFYYQSSPSAAVQTPSVKTEVVDPEANVMALEDEEDDDVFAVPEDQTSPKKAATFQVTCGKIERDFLNKFAKNNTLLITFVDLKMFKLFGRTWLHNIEKAGITYWVLAVPDAKTANELLQYNIRQCVFVDNIEIGNVHADFNWGSRDWQLSTWQKVLTNQRVASLGFNLIQSDIDVVWLQDPLHYFITKYTLPDYMVSLDPVTTKNDIGDDAPEKGVTISHYMNTGMYFLRNSTGGKKLIDKWSSIRKKYQLAHLHDQDGLYNFFKETGERLERNARITHVMSEQVKLAQLPVTLFQNSYTHTINRIHEVYKLQPYAVHFVWTYGHNYGKVHRMREQMYFEDPPSYYSNGKFVSVQVPDIKTPPNFNNWQDTEQMVRYHLKVVTQQMQIVYYGFALALALNRTLILPKMRCFCIHNWFESPLCRLPGEPHTQFPIICPADFIFDMAQLYNMNLGQGRTDIREYSFLENPKTPKSVTGDVFTVDVHTVTCKLCTVKTPTGVAVPPRLKGRQLDYLLKDHANHSILHFNNPVNSIAGFGVVDYKDDLNKAFKKLPLKWCCRTHEQKHKYNASEGENIVVKIPNWPDE